MVYAEYVARQKRAEGDLTFTDAIVIGVAQCFALIPGVSRSGATISAGLHPRPRPGDRDPAVVLPRHPGADRGGRAGGSAGQGRSPARSAGARPCVGTAVSFVVGYASIAWLLRFVATPLAGPFVCYRVAVGVLLIALLAGNVISAT